MHHPDSENQLLNNEKVKPKYKENDPDYKGTEMKSELAEGIIESRSCTDIIFLVLFIAFWAGMISIAFIAIKKGQPNRLASPFDSDGNHCGYTSGYESFPNIYFTDPTPDGLKKYVCVSECPKNNTSVLKCKNNSLVPDCEESPIYSTIKLIHICVPTEEKIWQQVKNSLSMDDLSEGLHDLGKSWSLLAGAALIAFVLGFIIMYIMKYCASTLIWGLIFLYLVLLSAFGVLFYFKSTGMYNVDSLNIDFLNNEFTNKKNVLIGLSITLWVVAFISLLLIICFVTRIKLAIAVMEEAANYIKSVSSTLFIPIGMFFVSICFFVFWLYVTIYLYSAGEFSQRGSTPFAHVAWDSSIVRLIVYYIIALFWNIEFLIALTQVIISFCVSYWYFSHGTNKTLDNVVWNGFCKTLRYHIGSIALGSFILTLIWGIKIVFEILYRQFKNTAQGHTNGCISFCYASIHCCLDCFQRSIRFLNSKAYIQMAITGQGFCSSAYDSFYLVFRNAGRFAALEYVGVIIMFFGKLFIAGCSGLICYIILNKVDYFSTQIYSPVIPTIFCILIAYLIGAFFMSVYSIAGDTILQCFCIDEEVHKTHKGSEAQYCPESLKNFLDQRN